MLQSARVLCGGMLIAAAAAQIQPSENVIHVEVGGLRNDQGQVVCALFSSTADFPKKPERAVAQTVTAISHNHSICEFSNINPGTYAVSVFHDENSNAKLDTKLMGIPKEGVGASNNVKSRFGPPKFEQASFPFAGGRLDLKITISYL